MAKLNYMADGHDFVRNGPQTPAQRFYVAYATAVVSTHDKAYPPHTFYTKTAVFHNQNGVNYTGAEIWPWILKLFKEFPRFEHEFTKVWEIENDDGTVELIAHLTRHIWAPGNNTDKPSVSVPVAMVCQIAPAENEGTPEGLQFRNVWFYWDTKLLEPYFPEDAIVFSTKNVSKPAE